MKRRVALVLAAAALLAGCTEPPKSGYVTDRKFHPAFYWVQMVCTANDPKTGACTFSVPVTHYTPDSYELCMVDDSTKERGCRDATVDEYEHYQIGMHYPDAQ